MRPPRLSLLTLLSGSAYKCDGAKCDLYMTRTQQSTLPPLVNAIEVYTIIQFPQSGTNQSDVSAIKNIRTSYGLSRIDWQGDPCVPQNFLWSGLKCNSTDMSTPPRIVSLNLSSSGLTGTVASSIQGLTQLQVLDLSNNNLAGEVPEFLAEMDSLTVINLSRNKLSGRVPQALLERSHKGELQLTLEGNLLCNTTSCKKNDKNKFIVPILASVASVAAITAVLVFIFMCRKKRASSIQGCILAVAVTRDGSTNLTEPSILRKKRRFTYSEIVEITKNFQRVLGKGGFGVVYHGYLNDTEQVAVKMLSESSAQGQKQFKAEVELLLRVHHVNLVSLVGYCDEADHVALVYEYMPNGDLKQYLSGKLGGFVLNWASRLRIAVDAALGKC
ncbi:PREDICTED: probable LRR receptor-like serine/threonine-protein kinase MEE39 [Tarenaya hassleriana]|uniref:probable LRR receptor-like serine/threonine-protein kinase MEE39 n=1 Tax=Tarenaya hassleriana TaxID=28532 RepID=UPI0008FD3812|nr:PREDICTED: probable LRR receptor-like serine/threonine-protein kinase MEE39 [Tarenaya hassleriana]